MIFSGSFINSKYLDFSKNGSSVPLVYIPLFTIISNVELYPFQGGQLIRAAGTGCILSSKFKNIVTLKLTSGWNITVSKYNISMLGSISNSSHYSHRYKNAGIKRRLGFRPIVRGVAMNPVDHPHGGGEGKKSPPVAARTPWGFLTKGGSTKKKLYQINWKKKFKKIR